MMKSSKMPPYRLTESEPGEPSLQRPSRSHRVVQHILTLFVLSYFMTLQNGTRYLPKSW